MSYARYSAQLSPTAVEAQPWSQSRGRTEEREESPFIGIAPRLRLGVLLVPLGIVLAALVGQLLLPQDKSPWLLPSLAIYALLLALPFLFYRPSFGWFHPIIITVLADMTGLLRKAGMYVYGLTSHTALPSVDAARLNELLAFELGLLALGYASYYIGFHLVQGVRFPTIPFPKPERMGTTAICFVGFSMVVFLAYMLSKGGLNAHISDFSHRSVKMDGEGFWTPFTHAGAVACLYWLACDRTAIRSPLFWMCAVPALCINFLTTGGRSHLVLFMGYGAMIVMLRARKIFFTQLLAILGVTLILVGVLGNFRRSTWKGQGQADWSTITQFNPFEAATGDAATEMARRSSATSPALAILERVPREVPHLFGSSYVGLLTFPMPKALWPDKPQGIHSLTGETFFGVIAGMPPGMLGEAYWNFNIPGVIGAFLLLGLIHRGLMLFYLRHYDRPGAVVLYLILLFCLKGDSGTIPYLLNILLPLAVLIPVTALASRDKRSKQVALGTMEQSYAG